MGKESIKERRFSSFSLLLSWQAKSFLVFLPFQTSVNYHLISTSVVPSLMLYFDHGSTEDDVILSSVLIYNKNKIKHFIQVSKSSSTTVLIEDAEMSKQIF